MYQSFQNKAPSLLRLGACVIYEALTMIALSFVGVWIFLMLVGDATEGSRRLMMQIFLWVMLGAYYIWCWVRSGRTLAMQAWRLRVVTQENARLSAGAAILRYLLASLSLLFFGIGFFWAFVDRNRLFLHDRILNHQIALD